MLATTNHDYNQYNQASNQEETFKMMSSTSPSQPGSGDLFGATSGAPTAPTGSSSNGSTTNTALDSSPAPNFSGDDEFDSLGIHIPPAALEDPHQAFGGGYHQHQGYQQQMYQQQQPQQHPMHHQQHWHQYHNGYQGYDQYNYHGSYSNGMYSSQQQQMNGGANGGLMNHNGSGVAAVGMGGPSPVGSHNTPSPHSHSDDGFLGGEDHVRNNNILKRPSPNPAMHGASVNPIGTIQSQAPMSHIPHHLGHGSHHHHHHPGAPYGHQYHPHHIPQGIPVTKKPKVSKRKKKRDPNEPSKPVSAYALFFRDSQASIKVANPNAAFGDVSKIVASLWDALDPDSKAAYKKRTENAKKEYLKKLAAYRASLVSKGGDSGIGYGYYSYGEVLKNNGIHSSATNSFLGQGSNPGLSSPAPGGGAAGVPSSVAGSGHLNSYGMSQPVPPRPPMQHQHPQGAYMFHTMGMQNGSMMGSHLNHQGPPVSGGSPSEAGLHHHHNNSQVTNRGPPGEHNGPSIAPSSISISSVPSSGSSTNNSQNSPKTSSSSSIAKGSAGQGSGKVCGRPGCNNPVNRGPEGWNSDFCSNECVVGQCKDVYTSWSSNGTPSVNRGVVPSQQPPPPNAVVANNSPGGGSSSTNTSNPYSNQGSTAPVK